MDTLPTLTSQLCDLTKRWNEFEDIPRSQQLECKAIGKKLDALGGMDAMREAYRVAHGHNRAASVVQAYWDGIGEWMW